MRESPFLSFKETFIFYFIRKAAKMEQRKAIMLMLVNDFMKKKINGKRKKMFRLSTIMLESLKFDRRVWSYERKDYWFEKLMENILNPDYQQRWRSHFRMSGSTFNFLIHLLRQRIEKRDTNFKKAVPIKRRIAIALWRLANGNSYRCVSEVFSIAQSTANEITALFCRSISEMVNHFILSFRKQELKQKTHSKNSSSVKTAKYRWFLVLLMEPTLQLWLRIMKIRFTTTIDNNDTAKT